MLHYAELKPSPTTRVLEAGCGTAMYALTLAVLGFAVDAFDYNEGALAFARRLEPKARQANPQLQIRLSRGNILKIDAESNTYDLVFNQAVLDYFQDEQERQQAFSEMVRVTCPGGWVATIVQHTGHPFRGWWSRLGWLGYTNQPQVIVQTPMRLTKELQRAGLNGVIVDGIYPWKAFFFYPPWYRRWKFTENLVYLVGQFLNQFVVMPRPFRSHLAIQFLAIGQKP